MTAADPEYGHLAPLLAEYSSLDAEDARRETLRDLLVTGYLPVAQHIARRFAGRGEPLDDLEQVATVGLINAVDRYDPERGADFFSFAVPTITGEVRRHFRDLGWSMRVPRRLRTCTSRSTARCRRCRRPSAARRSPRRSPSTWACRVEEVLEGLEASEAYRSSSLDEMLRRTRAAPPSASSSARPTPSSTRSTAARRCARCSPSCDERERTIVMLRFFGNMTQTQIAEQVGISQMHVSRLLAQTLDRLRSRMDPDTRMS